MLKVGLTGNIASGKSTVVRVWESLGATVIDADRLARRAVEPGTEALRRITEAWGTGVLDESGALDRVAMGEIVFRDPAARARLEAIIHPTVHALRDRGYGRAAAAGAPLVVADIPLLFEVGMEEEFDSIVLVDAPAGVRLERLIRDRGLDPAGAQRMIDSQIPSEQKLPRADFVVSNIGSLADLEREAKAVWHQLADLAAREQSAPAGQLRI